MPLIRPTLPDDVAELVRLTAQTGIFRPVEVITLEEVLEQAVAQPGGEGYHSYSLEEAGRLLGFSIHGPNTMTEGTWDLYWIVVERERHRRGLGSRLLHFVEQDIRKRGGRLLVAETSSLPSYEATRRFYLKHGFQETAVVPDYYADGDSLVIFCKRLRA
jgi:ribosomal protein S18 acetylase RimI-like enzyme